MPAISKEQAFALAMGAYIDPANAANNATFNINPNLTTTNRLNWLLTGSVNLPTIPLLGDLPNVPYTLVSTTTNVGGGVLDYIEGGDINDNNSITQPELNYHTTGRGILKKLK